MPDVGDLAELTAAVSAALTAAGIPHAITGAAALAVHGYLRGTKDIDILVVTSSLRLPEVFEIVRRHGFRGEDREMILSLRERYMARFQGDETLLEIFVPVLPFHNRILRRAVHRTVKGRDVPFVSKEDLIVQKMLWSRPKDLLDVEALVAQSQDLDLAYVRETLQATLPDGHAAHGEFERIVREFSPTDR